MVFISVKRKRQLEEVDIKARITRNQAITDYYNEKKKDNTIKIRKFRAYE